jgi:hypothetical protein
MQMARRCRTSWLTMALWLVAQSFSASPALAGGRGAARAEAPITLAEGATYRARLSLGFFECLASRDRITKKLSGSGFSKVRVFMSARELPPDWPPRYRTKKGSCERFAEGIWSRPTTPRKRPSSIDAWWMDRAPSLARR